MGGMEKEIHVQEEEKAEEERIEKALLASKRELVLRAGEPLEPRYAVYDKEQRRVGSLLDIFGAVSNPYLVIKPAQTMTHEDMAALFGKELYIMGYMSGRKTRKEAHVSGMRGHKARAKL
jgi:rRNA processing protein Gar1